jgi:hypothetical protein
MNLEQVKQDINQWIENFLEVPHPSLGNWSPCPYARRARLNQTVGVFIGTDPAADLKTRCELGMQNWEVAVYVYDSDVVTHEQLSASIEQANTEFLTANDLIALEDHPSDPEIVNGVSMNQGTYAMAMVQSLSDLNQKAQAMAVRGFYHTWPEEYLQQLFQHRQDPRS